MSKCKQVFRRARPRRALTGLLCALAALWLPSAAAEVAADAPAVGPEAAAPLARPAKPLRYKLDYEARFAPEHGSVQVSLTVRQPRDLLREVRFSFDPERYGNFSADGELAVEGTEVRWRPPLEGGRLAFSLTLNHQRRGGAFDSLMEEHWAVFRGDDLFPPATVTAVKGAHSRARLRLSGPDDWSFISPYPRTGPSSEWFRVDWEDRNFDRPVGWMAAGRLAVRRETIAGRKVAVAGPTGQGVRHLDMLAFLHWNLPKLVEVFPHFPGRLLLVAAGDPMWRGGLSGPHSLYLHADRPLLSGNGTSTLLHELVHVAQAFRARHDEDWIVEGIAEFYTLELMHRSGTISKARRDRGFEKLEQWAERIKGLEGQRSTGARTAKGVTVMRALDAELRRRSDGKHSLDDVARTLAENGVPVSVERLRRASAALAGGPLDALSDKALAEY
ncbi:MAG: hypothetical protein MUE63_06565 [Xanthomonadales bacterium]|jgi:hypothetical protein|nr:hypothetical protein [Xanthomonadales bacterium]